MSRLLLSGGCRGGNKKQPWEAVFWDEISNIKLISK